MEGDRVVLTLHSAMALEYARKVGLDARLETLMLDVFRLRVQAVLCCQEDVDEQHKRLEALEAKAREAVREQAEQAAKETRSKPKREAEGRIMGAAIGAAQTTPVGELAEDSGRVTVRGEVIAADCRELSGGKMRLLTFSLTDYTSTIGCKALLFYSRRRQGGEESHAPTAEEIARVEAIAKAVRPGCWLTVRGDCQYDKFAREVVVRVSDIEAAQAPVREDRAERKRVELHLHTQMSSMDGVSSATALIAQAAAWGHPAVAVTDHGVLQAFPEAFAAAKKHGIKLIPGIEGYLIDEAVIVEGADERAVGSETVVLDFETTGLAPKRDRVIEIGAVKMAGEEIVGELSLMIDPGIPLPSKITEITGITNDMVRGQPRFEQAAEQLLDFIGDAALAAHNASFDVAFLQAELARCGMRWQGPVIDTLAFARKAYPTLKSHRLGAVCPACGREPEKCAPGRARRARYRADADENAGAGKRAGRGDAAGAQHRLCRRRYRRGTPCCAAGHVADRHDPPEPPGFRGPSASFLPAAPHPPRAAATVSGGASGGQRVRVGRAVPRGAGRPGRADAFAHRPLLRLSGNSAGGQQRVPGAGRAREGRG